ncbi:MAG: hypothetical protein IKS83_03340 [Victivallales bacterium]|nr:hypothetical protein [Victivallales bacterium]
MNDKDLKKAFDEALHSVARPSQPVQSDVPVGAENPSQTGKASGYVPPTPSSMTQPSQSKSSVDKSTAVGCLAGIGLFLLGAVVLPHDVFGSACGYGFMIAIFVFVVRRFASDFFEDYGWYVWGAVALVAVFMGFAKPIETKEKPKDDGKEQVAENEDAGDENQKSDEKKLAKTDVKATKKSAQATYKSVSKASTPDDDTHKAPVLPTVEEALVEPTVTPAKKRKEE